MSDFITNAELRIESERLCDENERLEAENAELRHDLEEANNQAEEVCIENAKLRESVKRLMTQRDERLARAEAENAKLRELSSIMLKCIKANERRVSICWECPMHKQFDELRSYCCLEHEAKKLGVEVG